MSMLLSLLTPILLAASPLAQEKAESGFLASGGFKAEHLATLSLTAPFTPRIGPWSVLADVYAGAGLDLPVWELRGAFSTKAGRINAGAATLFLTGFGPPAAAPLMELTMLQTGERRDCWQLLNTDEVRPIPKYFLTPGFIRDRHGIFTGEPEYEAYWQFLVQSHYSSAKAFAQAARQDVTYAHLFNEPERYRGEVVRVSGRLIRLMRWEPPMEARAAGVRDLYEGWIMTDDFGENPVCIAFTDLPPDLAVDNRRKYNEPVRFDGYFYKRYRYKAIDSKKANEYRDAPLLIGHTLSGRFGSSGGVGEEAENWGHNLIWVFFGVIGAAVLALLALTGWFRYQDRRVRQRIRASRSADFVPPAEEFSD